MNNKELEKPAAAFEVNIQNNAKKIYSIRCILIEQGKVISLKCATNLQDEKSAKGLRNFLERNWDNHNKIIRFYDNPKNVNIKITKYCEIRPRSELENLVEHYRMRGKPKVKDNSEKETKLYYLDFKYLKKCIAHLEKRKCPRCGELLPITFED